MRNIFVFLSNFDRNGSKKIFRDIWICYERAFATKPINYGGTLMKFFSTTLIILMSGYFSYGMDNNNTDTNLLRQNNLQLVEVETPEINATTNGNNGSSIFLTVEQESFSHLNANGLAILEEQANEAYHNLSKWQLERIRHYAAHGQFEAYKGLIKFWRFVEGGAFPLSELCQLVTAGLPLLSIFTGSKFDTGMKVLTTLFGVLGLFFGRISDFAGQRIAEETAISDILLLLQNNHLANVPPPLQALSPLLDNFDDESIYQDSSNDNIDSDASVSSESE